MTRFSLSKFSLLGMIAFCLLPCLFMVGILGLTMGARGASASYPVDNVSIILGGLGKDDFIRTDAGNANSRQCYSTNFEFDFVATGTDCTFHVDCGASYQFRVIVDGGAPTALAGTGAYSNMPMFTGLTDAPHTVQLQQLGSANGNCFYDGTNSFTVTGASPTVSRATGFGPPAKLQDHLADGYISFEDTWVASNPASYITGQNQLYRRSTRPYDGNSAPEGAIHFQGRGTTIKAWVEDTSYSMGCILDGKYIGTLYGGGTNQFGWKTIITGLSDVVHDVVLSNGQVVSPAFSLQIHSVMFCDGAAPALTAAVSPRTMWAVYGDSITENSGVHQVYGTIYAPLPDTSQGWGFQLGLLNGVGIYNKGISSTTATNIAGGSTAQTTYAGQTRTADITSLSPAPKKVIILYGRNDTSAIQSANTTISAFQSAYQSMLTSLLAGLPTTTTIECFQPLNYNVETPALRTSVANAIQSAIQAVGSNRVRYFDTNNVISYQVVNQGAGNIFLDQFDGLHPNAVGNAKVATYMSQKINTTASIYAGSQIKRGR